MANEDLEVARRLASAGIPLFLAAPDDSPVGYRFPSGWQKTVADPSVVDQWREGLALCAVGGHGLDFVDVDPRHKGDDSYASLNGSAPFSYGWVATPSSGFHSYVASMGVRSLNGTLEGVDVKAGDPGGEGRGFVFLPPTVRVSKVDGVCRPYTWFRDFDFEGWVAGREGDCSGAGLAELVRRKHSDKAGGAGGIDTSGMPERMRQFFTQKAPQSASAASRAITKKLEEVSYWRVDGGAGFRETLMSAAFTLGGYVGGQFLEREHAHERLCGAVSVYWGSPDSDDLAWIEAGLDDGEAEPFEVYADAIEGAGVGDPLDMGGAPPPGLGALIGEWAFEPLGDQSDQGFAHAALQRTYPVVRFAPDSGQWLTREGWKWVADAGDASGWVVSTLADMMPLGEKPVPKKLDERTERHWQAVRRDKFVTSGSASGIERKMRTLVARSGNASTIRIEHLDAEPEILWADGVPYDLRASLAVPKAASLDPNTPHLHNALCRPEDRETPRWDAFLKAVWPDEAERSWALRVLSIALTGYSDAALPVLWGEERNGKTSVVEFLLDVLGTYGVVADPKLLAGVDSAHASIVYALKGARLAFVDEGPRRGHLATERLKQLTGGGRLTGNAMRANPVTFKTTHTLIMTSNDTPPMTDPALRARIRAIHCRGDRREVRARREALDQAAWRREAPGVLYQMILQASGWLADRSSALTENAPASFREMEEEAVAEQNPVREWVSDCTIPADPGTPGRQLYHSFCSWLEGKAAYRKTPAPSETSFGRTLTDLGFPSTQQGVGTQRARYRPLSVFSGPMGWAPEPNVPGRVEVGLVPSSEVVPDASQTPSSGDVLSSFMSGRSGTTTTTTTANNKYTQKEYIYNSPQLNMEPSPNPTENGPQTRVPPAKSGGEGYPTTDVTSRSTTADTPEPPKSLPVVSGGLTKEAAEVARIAAEKKISKLEARKQLKEELIREAVAGAEGPHAQLPAAVDRQGRVLACTEDIVRVLLDPVIEAGALTVDVETTGYPIGHVHYRLKTVQLGGEAVAVVLDPDDEAQRLLISEYLGRAIKLHAHSASADLVPLAVAGLLDYDAGWAKMHDTVIPAKLGDPQSTGSDPGLKKLSAAVLGDQAVAPVADEGREALFKAGKWLTNTKPHHPVEKSGWAQVNPRSAVMLRYAASDVLDTAALAKRLPPVRSDIEDRERVAEEMTARIAYRGFKIDHERVRTLTAEHSALQAQFGAQVRAFGIENPGSAQQVAARLAQMGAQLPLTPGGSPSVAEHVLSVLRRSEGEKGVLAGAVLDYRHSSTVLGLFLAPYAQLCDLGDGRARPTVYTMGADTGRMTCTRPNAQQLPRAGGIRSIYTADPGMVFISADFSGVELRGAAALSQDPDMIRMIAEEDAGRFDGFHWQIARQAYGPDASKADRYTAKRGVFGTFYGGGAAGLSKQIGVTEQEMFVIIDSLKSIAPGYFRWADGVRQAVRNGSTQFPSCSGRIIHLDQSTPHKAPAYCIQGSCRELLIDALLRWRDTRWGNTTVLPIHDELIAMVPADEAHDATLELVRCMESSLYGVEIKADPGKFDDVENERFTGSSFWRDAE